MSNKSQNDKETLVEYIPLKVPAGALLSVGAGIYNSVAAAFNEFVSNSFDADATAVTILTDFPRFEQITIVDDGTGMTARRFKQAMQIIGTSLKGTIDPIRVTAKHNRPIIGRLGIGLMALCQLCDKATIESTVSGDQSKFIAELDFSAFKKQTTQLQEAAQLDVLREQYGGLHNMKRILDSPETEDYVRSEVQEYYELALKASQILKDKTLEDPEGEHLGFCVIYGNLPALSYEHGTTITLEGIASGVQDFLLDKDRPLDALPQSEQKQSDKGWAEYRQEVDRLKWQKIVEKLQMPDSGLSYQSLPQYHQFLWELAIMSPVRYLPDGPITDQPQILAHKKKELSRFNFSVIVDNRWLFKPILLPSGGNSAAKMAPHDYHYEKLIRNINIGGDLLSYQGYIYWQRTPVHPRPLRGIQIYIRHVGIALHDQTLMNFITVDPLERAENISGEIYVEKGLERALNLARNGFREKDEHYVALQKHVWEIINSLTKCDRVNGKMARNKNSPSWHKHEPLLSQRVLTPVRAALTNGSSSEDVLRLLERLVLDFS